MGKIGKAIVGGVGGFVSSGGNPLGAVAGAAGGLMSSGGKQAGQKQTGYSEPLWKSYGYIPPALENQVKTATDLMNKPYEAYTGNRVAGLTADEQQAMELARNLSGGADISWSQGVNQQVANRGLNGFDQSTLAQYMNPYIQNVMDISRQRQLDQFDLAKRDLQQRQGATGAFGGSRSSLATGQLYDNFSRQLAEQEANQLYQGYNDAQTRALQGTQLAGQAAGQYGTHAIQNYNTGLAGIDALSKMGALDRNIQQQGLDVEYENYLTKQDYPYKQLQFGQSIINPVAQITSGQSTAGNTVATGGPSGTMKALAGGLGAAGIFGNSGFSGGISNIGNNIGQMFGGSNTAYSQLGGNMFGFGSGTTSGGAFGGGYGTYGSLGGINWFKDGGQVKGYAGGGIIDSIANWMSDYMNIGNDQFGTESNDTSSWLNDFLHTDITGGKSYNDLSNAYAGHPDTQRSVYPDPTTPNQPLSVRNNNAGNLRDPRTGNFRQFTSPQEGLNAMMQDLTTKVTGKSPMMRSQYGLDYTPSIENIIKTWAPESDGNNPEMYAAQVAKALGKKPTDTLTPADVPSLAKAMTFVEGGPKAAKYFDSAYQPTLKDAALGIADRLRIGYNNAKASNEDLSNTPLNTVPEYASSFDKLKNTLSNVPAYWNHMAGAVGKGLLSPVEAMNGFFEPNLQHAAGADKRLSQNRQVAMANQKRAEGDLGWFNQNRQVAGKAPLKSIGNSQADAIFAQLTGQSSGKTAEPMSEKPSKQDNFNAPLVAFGAAILGSRGNNAQALSEGMKAYATEKTTKEAEIAKLAQQAIDNKIRQQNADSNTMNSMGGPYAQELARSKILTAIAKAKGNPGKATMDILKIFGQAGVPMDTPESQAAALQAAQRMAEGVGTVSEDAFDPEAYQAELDSRQQLIQDQ